MRSLWLANLIVASGCLAAWGQPVAEPFSRSVIRIEPGTVVGRTDQPRWNRVVALAKPRIASGDTDSLAGFIRETVARFVLTILATVDQVEVSSGQLGLNGPPVERLSRYRLAEVGVGYSLQIADQLRVIRSDDYEAHGAQLSFFDRQLLAENERQFGQIRTVARASSLLIFDVPAILLQDGQRRLPVPRYLIWIDSNTGQLATMTWLLQPEAIDQLRVVVSRPLRWLDSHVIEDRAIHVDGKQFTLGIPGKRAFALEGLPPGRDIGWTEAAQTLAGREHYDRESLHALMVVLNEANQASLR